MKVKSGKPAPLWLKSAFVAVLLLGLTVGYEIFSTSGLRCFPSVQLDANRAYTLHVSGTGGVRFRGVVSIMMADGRSEQHSIAGMAPKSFVMFGKSISVEFTKCEENGSLDLRVKDGNCCLVEKRTTAPYGSVSIRVD